jgi:hypothetical protein
MCLAASSSSEASADFQAVTMAGQSIVRRSVANRSAGLPVGRSSEGISRFRTYVSVTAEVTLGHSDYKDDWHSSRGCRIHSLIIYKQAD